MPVGIRVVYFCECPLWTDILLVGLYVGGAKVAKDPLDFLKIKFISIYFNALMNTNEFTN